MEQHLNPTQKFLRVLLHFVIGEDRKRKTQKKLLLIICCRGFFSFAFEFQFDNYKAKLLRKIFLSFENFFVSFTEKLFCCLKAFK